MKRCKECEFFVENKRVILIIKSLAGRAFKCEKYSMGITLRKETDIEELTCIYTGITGNKANIEVE